MSADQFESELRKFTRARPFKPYLVILEDGRTLFIDKPAAAINSGGAGLVDSHREIHLIECEQVRELRPAHEELAK